MRTAITRKPKRNNNECPECLKEEGNCPYCRRCDRWVLGRRSEVHHNPPKQMGGTTAVYCNHPVEHGNPPGHRLEKLCGDCHKDETENRVEHDHNLRER
jgi:hypothetical protein